MKKPSINAWVKGLEMVYTKEYYCVEGVLEPQWPCSFNAKNKRLEDRKKESVP